MSNRWHCQAELTNYTEAFCEAIRFQHLSSTRFIASFIENGILHVENEQIVFTLPFVAVLFCLQSASQSTKLSFEILFYCG